MIKSYVPRWLPICAVAGLLVCLVGRAANAADAEQWTPLLHGDSLAGWHVLIAGQKEMDVDPTYVFSVHDGVVHAYRDTPAGAKAPFAGLLSDQEYADYRLRLEYKWGEKKFAPRTNAPRDAGILYHVTAPLKIWPLSVECQIQEHDVGDIYAVNCTVDTTIDPQTKNAFDATYTTMSSPVFQEAADGGVALTQSALGSPYNVGRVRRSREWEHDGWNTVEVIVRGDSATHIVNGHVNNRCTKMRRPDPQNPQRTLPLTKGRILLQAEGAEIFYRNIEIKPLGKTPTPPTDSSRSNP